MVKTRFVVLMISAIALFTTLASAAHAGGGMGAGTATSTCRVVLGGAPNQLQTIDLNDDFVSGDRVKVGAAVLLCDLAATGITTAGPLTGNPITVTNATKVTCYSVSGADQAKIKATMRDPFTEAPLSSTGTQPVQIGAIQLLCVASEITDIQP